MSNDQLVYDLMKEMGTIKFLNKVADFFDFEANLIEPVNEVRKEIKNQYKNQSKLIRIANEI